MKPILGRLMQPRNASPVPLAAKRGALAGLFGGVATDTRAQLDAMGSVGTLFAIIDQFAESTSSSVWRLWRRPGPEADRTQVHRHAFLDLWARPNRFYTQSLFMETEQQHYELTGGGYAVITKRGGIPIELWPVRPDRITLVPHPTEFLSHYIYTSPDGEKYRLEVDEVLPLRRPHPKDPYKTISQVETLLADIAGASAAADWNAQFFRNGAWPGGIVEVPEGLSDDEFNQTSDRLREQHQGVSNAHRVLILEHGKWVDRKFSPKDLMLSDLANTSSEKIREAYGFPKFLLGNVDDVNRANAEASEGMYARWRLRPRLDRWKDAINNYLLPMYGDPTLEVDYESPEPLVPDVEIADRDSKVAAAVALVNAGADADAVSEYLELPTELFANYVRPEPVQIAPPEARRPRAIATRPRAELSEELDDELEQAQVHWEATLNRLIADWDAITGAQRTELADQIRSAVDREDLPALAELTLSSEDGAALLADGMAALAALSAAQVAQTAAQHGVEVEPAEVDNDVLGAVATLAAALLAAGLANAAGREAARAATPGRSGDEVAADVDRFIGDLTDRALRDQLGGALTQAQNTARAATLDEIMQVADPPPVLYASERNDRNTCSPCREVDGRSFADLAAALAVYPSGGYYRCEGGVRCRGTIVAVWPE